MSGTSTIRARLEAAAARWDAAGRPPGDLWRGMDYLVGYCWFFSGAGLLAGCAPVVGEFVRASQAAFGGGYDALLAQRMLCDRCGTTYRLENLAVCTDCRSTLCPSCVPARSAGGNPPCGCGGELVG